MRLRLVVAPLSLILVASAVVATPAHAGGATASRSGSTITIVGSDGPDVISVDANVWDGIIDSAGITAGGGCDQINDTEVKCGALDEGTQAVITLNGGDDRFSWTAATGALSVDGGPGNDTIDGGSAGDRLLGGDGSDTITGANGNDTIDGGSGNDNLTGGQDDDVITGGPGQDIVNADGQNNAAGNWFGNDQVFVRDGERDVVTCGFGTDVVTADAKDVFDSEGSCESIDRSGSAASSDAGSVATDQPQTSAGTITMTGAASSSLSAALRKGYALTITSPVPCKATIGVGLTAAEAKRVLKKSKVVMLDGQQGDTPAGTIPLKWKLAAKYAAAFAKAKPVKTIFVFTCDTADGQTATVTKQVTFR